MPLNGSDLDNWKVEYESGIPVYRQIINQVHTSVATGNFKTGDQLPTIRSLSEYLKVNPNTVAKAYRELELKGIIVSERGSGSFIHTDATTAVPEVKERKARLKDIYQRLLTEAANNGLSEGELLAFIKEKNPSTI